MINVSIPGLGAYRLKHLVLDYNGTLARDGIPLKGIKALLRALAMKMEIHIVTADTFGSVRKAIGKCPCKVTVLEEEQQDKAKADYVKRLGSRNTAAVGNGRNDRIMLKTAELGIAVIQDEGAAGDTVRNADIICKDIFSALELFIKPARMIASLRS